MEVRTISTAAALVAAFFLTSCATSAPHSECDGWSKLNPSSATRGFIVSNDVPFAREVAAHNRTGENLNCW